MSSDGGVVTLSSTWDGAGTGREGALGLVRGTADGGAASLDRTGRGNVIEADPP